MKNKRRNIAKIMLAASAVTTGTAIAKDEVKATELKNNDNYMDKIDSRTSYQRGEVINAPASLRVRSSASTNSTILGYLSNGTEVSIISENGSWYRIQFNGAEGFVHGDYIKITSSAVPSVKKGTITNVSTTLNIRQEPNTTSKVLTTLRNNTSIDILDEIGLWYKVKYNEVIGYAHSDYVKTNSNSNNNSNNSSNNSSNGSISKKGRVINVSTSLNVRQYANTTSAIIKTLRNGDTFDILSKSSGWYNIKSGTTVGFIHGDYVEEINTGSTESTPQKPSEDITSFTGKVINVATNLRVRSGPGTTHSTLGYLLNGENVKVTGENGQWYKIDYKGKDGYVHRDYIEKTSQVVVPPTAEEEKPETPSKPEVTSKYGQVINVATNLRVRSEASTNSSVIGYLLNGQRVTITGEANNWYMIDFNGTNGYVSSEYIKIVDKDEVSDYNEVFNRVFSIMKEHVGSPYVWGGTGEMLTTTLLNTLKNRYPNETARGMYTRAEQYVDKGHRAFDCSGLMQWGFSQVGIKLGRSTWHQIENGYEVSLDDIRPGDLLFNKNLTHVGMYIGNGQWIEAPNQNANVRIVNVPWSSIGRARRVIK